MTDDQMPKYPSPPSHSTLHTGRWITYIYELSFHGDRRTSPSQESGIRGTPYISMIPGPRSREFELVSLLRSPVGLGSLHCLVCLSFERLADFSMGTRLLMLLSRPDDHPAQPFVSGAKSSRPTVLLWIWLKQQLKPRWQGGNGPLVCQLIARLQDTTISSSQGLRIPLES